MWLGLTAGAVYALTGFRGQGIPPRLACTCGPFRKGTLYCRGSRIYHWMFCAPLSIVAILIGAWNFASFCAVMTLHGISYSDAFQLRDTPSADTPHDTTDTTDTTNTATLSSLPQQRAHTQEHTSLEIHADGGE